MKRGGKQKQGSFSKEYLVYIVLFVIALLVLGRLFWLQVVQSSDLKMLGVERRTSAKSILPQRGAILDAQGNVLAQSIPVKLVFADPNMLTELASKNQLNNAKGEPTSKAEIAKELGEILSLDPNEVLVKLNKNLSWVSLARQVDVAKAEEIALLKIPGVGFEDEEQRVYPMDSLGASVLGIVNMTGHGVEGLESYYDTELFGKPGYLAQEQAVSSNANVSQPNKPALAGNSLVLTLDSTIQHLIEQQLDDLMQTTKAKSVTILAMDPMSGKILGMGSRPTFNPNTYTESNPEDRRPLGISLVYEPGSTFKSITGAAALEEGVINPDDLFDDPGYLKIKNRIIMNWDSDLKPHGSLTFTEGMKLSSNVVLAQVGMKLGLDNFYTFLKAFGFGAKTGVDITGEESGLLLPRDRARDIDLATMSFGQTNLVTPIQLLNAVGAIANGGTLYKPYIVEKILSPMNSVVQQNKPQVVRQAVSKATAEQMNEIMTKVVDEGTGAIAKIPGVKVAGKTGTAQKVDPQTGEYSKTDFVASFVAFAPADNPKISVLIVIDTPQGEVHQGGTLAGPRAQKILEGALQYYGIPVAKDTPSTVNLSPTDPPVRTTPELAVPERPPAANEVVVPNLTGVTVRQAGEMLGKLELRFEFEGSGLAVTQNLTPGKVVNKGSTVKVTFAPP